MIPLHAIVYAALLARPCRAAAASSCAGCARDLDLADLAFLAPVPLSWIGRCAGRRLELKKG